MFKELHAIRLIESTTNESNLSKKRSTLLTQSEFYQFEQDVEGDLTPANINQIHDISISEDWISITSSISLVSTD